MGSIAAHRIRIAARGDASQMSDKTLSRGRVRLHITLAHLSALAVAASSVKQCQQQRSAAHHAYTLLSSQQISPDSRLLRFALPAEMPTLGAPLPSCMKVKQTFSGTDGEFTLDKSYSPVSLPDQQGFLELLVKGYSPRNATHPATHGGKGGLGAFLVDLQVGQSADMIVKAPRLFHGQLYSTNRWTEIGMVAGGTGIAPMVQMIRTILADPTERTAISLVFANRHERDILMRQDLESLAAQHRGRFKVHFVLSSPPEDWSAGRGWVTATDMAILPKPNQSNVMILVCGRDEFLDTVSGRTTRGKSPKPGKKGPKIQGELTGLLAQAGYDTSQVYKF